jgi:flagellar hook-basal body complex protein FliE
MMDDVTIRAGGLAPAPPAKAAAGARGGAPSFGAALKDAIAEINDLQLRADEAITKVQLHDTASLHEAIIALEKADISFRTMMQVRNKIVEAYQEIMRLQV